MANKNTWVSRLRNALTKHKSVEESQGEAGKTIPIATYGESIIKESFENWKKNDTMRKIQQEYQGASERFAASYTINSNQHFTFKDNTNDCVVEVFVTPIAERIKKPYDRGVAFELCKLERWYAPDCRPGIISWIVQPHNLKVYARREPLIVLFAEDQYIELRPNQGKIADPEKLRLCQLHFEQRGFDFLDENQTLSPFDLLDYQKEIYDGYSGQAAKEIGIGSDWSYGRSLSNPSITSGRSDNNRTAPKTPKTSTWGDPTLAEWQYSKKIQITK